MLDLTEDEAVEAYNELVGTLRDKGLNWVVAEVEEKIALGNIQTKRIKARRKRSVEDEREGLSLPKQKSSGKTEVYAVSEAYTGVQRLEILLDAIVLAVPVANAVSESTLTNLHSFKLGETLWFEPEADVREAFSLSQGEVEGRKEASDKLRRLIKELRGGGNVANQTDAAR